MRSEKYKDDINLVIHLYLKAKTTKKMRLKVLGHFQGEHLYIFTDKGITMK